MPVADNIVIGVFHLKDETMEEKVWSILIGAVDYTSCSLTVLAEGV